MRYNVRSSLQKKGRKEKSQKDYVVIVVSIFCAEKNLRLVSCSADKALAIQVRGTEFGSPEPM